MDPRRPRSPLVPLALVALLAVGAAASIKKWSAPARPAARAWLEGAAGFAEAEQAEREGRGPVLVYFHTDWCGYCKKMEKDLFPAGPVRAYLDGMVKVRLNPERSPDERAIADQYQVHGYPALFVEREGQRSKVHPFVPVGGGWNQVTPAQFVAELRGDAAQ